MRTPHCNRGTMRRVRTSNDNIVHTWSTPHAQHGPEHLIFVSCTFSSSEERAKVQGTNRAQENNCAANSKRPRPLRF